MSEKEQYSCGCSDTNTTVKHRSVPVIGRIATDAGNIDVVSTKWSMCDHIGEIKVRLDIARMNYAIAPGVYAFGRPDSQSPVLVSANYKLSFDVLRRELEGLDVWILVIDTKGVNVWCAAGKGTFGTQELVERVKATQLDRIVSTRKLILPQLGAPGISAHTVKALCGFQVVYGPVQARDLKKFFDAGMKADPAMRRVYFGVMDRLTVSWLELAVALKAAVLGTVLLAVLIVLTSTIPALTVFKGEAWMLLILFWASVLSGTVLNAVLLPYLPGRAFSLKGGLLGAFIAVVIIYISKPHLALTTTVAYTLMSAGLSAFLALNFTGASTYTSLSGVKKEIRYSIPAIIAMVSAGALLEIVHIVRRLI
ncbi:MAG: acetyl-CoA synthase subunit gamma [Candidatus Omnitrophica bacterium]|nr:acetyl-CoA synthase subunit gamma [Candidatus Omnitrophota bacterium]